MDETCAQTPRKGKERISDAAKMIIMKEVSVFMIIP
jgi:hypothetical protein